MQLCDLQDRGGGQREDKRREGRWGGQGGGGRGICQRGLLGSSSERTEGRKKMSEALYISFYPFITLFLFISILFHTASGFTLFFSLFSSVGFFTCLLPMFSALFIVGHPSFLSQTSISPQHLLSTCIPVFILTISSLLSELKKERKAWLEICAGAFEIAPPHQESGC